MKCITLVPKFSVELFIHNFNDANVLEKFYKILLKRMNFVKIFLKFKLMLHKLLLEAKDATESVCLLCFFLFLRVTGYFYTTMRMLGL